MDPVSLNEAGITFSGTISRSLELLRAAHAAPMLVVSGLLGQVEGLPDKAVTIQRWDKGYIRESGDAPFIGLYEKFCHKLQQI